MNESKELLEATIKGLEEKLSSVTGDLNMKNRELEEVNKPVMTSEMFENLTELVDNAIEEVTIEECDLEYSMEIDYENKVELTDVSLQDTSSFTDKIMSYIDMHYKIEETVNPTESTSG